MFFDYDTIPKSVYEANDRDFSADSDVPYNDIGNTFMGEYLR